MQESKREDHKNYEGPNPSWAEDSDEYGPLTDEDAVYNSVKKKEEEIKNTQVTETKPSKTA